MTNDAERVSDIVAELRKRVERTEPEGFVEVYIDFLSNVADIIEAQSKALAEARGDFECEDCIGMKATHGCYYDAMGAGQAGGPKKGSIRDDESTASAMERAQHLRERGWLLEAAAERLEQEAHDRAEQHGEHTGTDGI